MEYLEIKKDKIYRLINTCPLLLIATVSKQKKYNVAPIAWVCPAELDPPRILICIDKSHLTFKNIKETGVFAAAIPDINQIDIVKKTGGVSGKDVDKFEEFKIDSFFSKKLKIKIINKVIGYLECKVKKIITVDSATIVIGDIIYAAARKKAFDGEHLLAHTKYAKAMHHLGKNKFITYGDKVVI
jgi:flavin reductase (DIM6/NTAB) family NADH-FMN oxidoreductase RutF